MSQIISTGTGGGGGIVTTLAADAGSATGATINVIANHAANAAGSSVLTTASASTLVLHVTDASFNTLIGDLAGNLTLSGSLNTGLGYEALHGLTTGLSNVAIGNSAMVVATTATECVAIGSSALDGLLTGTNIIAIGYLSGSALVGAESNSILIGNIGTAAQSGAIHIGTAGTHTATYIAGVEGVAVANTNMVTINTATGQMGSQAVPGSSISITGDTGGALVGSAFTFTGGSTGLSFGGAGSTETLSGTLAVGNGGTGATALTGVIIGNGGAGPMTASAITQHDVLVGGASNAITSITAGTTGQVLTGVTGADPSFQSPAASSISLTGDSGGALTGAAFTVTGGATGLTFAGAGSTETLGGTLAIANGGTNASSFTQSNGIVVYNGTSLVNYVGPQISTGGIATNSAQPAFLILANADTANVTGDGTLYTMVYDTIVFDQNSNLSGLNTFTAPVTGKYSFTFSVNVTNIFAANTTFHMDIVTTAQTFDFSLNPAALIIPNGFQYQISCLANMSATDTAITQVLVNGGAKTVGIQGNGGAVAVVTFWSGYLVC